MRIEDAKSTKSLKTLLTGRRAVASDNEKQVQQQATPYEADKTDIDYIMRQMMFFKASGGRSYSHLTNNYQPFVDFSELIKLDRAVLVAFAPATAAKTNPSGALLLRDGEPVAAAADQHKTIYRFVFEVKANDDKNAKSD